MTDSASDGAHCTFARYTNLGAWLAPVPRDDVTGGGRSWRRPSLPTASLMTVGLVAAATLLRLAINPFVAGAQFPPFFLAAIIATLLGGVCMGLLSVALSTLSAWVFIQPPAYSFALDPGTAYDLITFHHRGANYPDALLLDHVLKRIVQNADLGPELYLADVGHPTYQSLHIEPAGSGGYNYGWSTVSGTHCLRAGCDQSGITAPTVERTGGCIIGGYVYRGSQNACLQGWYLYGDYCTRSVRALTWDGSAVGSDVDLTSSLGAGVEPSSFGQDADGELYLVDYRRGTVSRFDAN
jgi:hypothetical protein